MSGNLRRYQIVLFGPDLAQWRGTVISSLRQRINEVSDALWESIDILDGNEAAKFNKSSPVFAIWFGSTEPIDHDQLVALHSLLNESKSVQPVVRDFDDFAGQVPPRLREINGLVLDGSSLALDRLTNAVLEGMQFLRRRRRLFISYARRDTRSAAKQLFGALAERGYDVFLDTHTVPATSVFQNQLWHSMVDSDLVVLLDSNGIDNSHWCRQEYEKADALSIGVVRVIWPNRVIDPTTDALLLSLAVPLTPADFVSNSGSPIHTDMLTDGAINKIAENVEGFRARSIAARQANLVRSFEREATRQGVTVAVQPNLHIHIKRAEKGRATRKIAVIPTIGVPISTNFHDAFIEYGGHPPDVDAQVILYDRQGFLPHWVDHLTWLNGSLPVKGIDIREAPQWLTRK